MDAEAGSGGEAGSGERSPQAEAGAGRRPQAEAAPGKGGSAGRLAQHSERGGGRMLTLVTLVRQDHEAILLFYAELHLNTY